MTKPKHMQKKYQQPHAAPQPAAQPDPAAPTHAEATPVVGASPPPDSAAAAEDTIDIANAVSGGTTTVAPASAGTAISTAKTAGAVEPLKLTKQGHAELLSGLAKGLRRTLEGLAKYAGFNSIEDGKGAHWWVDAYREELNLLATYDAEVERADG